MRTVRKKGLSVPIWEHTLASNYSKFKESIVNDTYFGPQTDSIPWFSAAGEKSNAKEVAFGVEAEHNGSQSLPYPPMHREHNLK